MCISQTATLTASGANSYTWSSGSNNSYEIVTPTITSLYSVNGTNANGCSNSSSALINVIVNPLPIIGIAISNSLICAGQSSTLIAVGANTYTWSTGGATANEVVSPIVTTTYSVMGIDANGCSNTAFITQSVNLCTGLNTFAEPSDVNITIYPNPVNEILNIVVTISIDLTGIKKHKLELINAFGQIVQTNYCMGQTTKINMKDFSAGLYTLKANINGSIVTKKIIKE